MCIRQTLHLILQMSQLRNGPLLDNSSLMYNLLVVIHFSLKIMRNVRGLLEKYPTFGREKETGLLGALDT